ncbi:hypothetical protein NW77_010 [Erwinia phage phiEa2809]|uniref:Uncharacterized protein n=1 Tax=Erwinia phage phiEa2809 TaxID=1564096 RepID=A0A0A0YXA8_9CAUD|nr:hypothetical protein NW77_010 [Erwinia phage phiEa2809]AIX13018.1 hypothetical protein NW77_010 [Erwinia phage phiEa2809]
MKFAGYFELKGPPPKEGENDYRRWVQLSGSTFTMGTRPLYVEEDVLVLGDPAPLQIVAAANKYVYHRTREGGMELYPCEVIICGHRHYDMVMRSQLDIIKRAGFDLARTDHVQGFIDNRGNFHDRKAALVIATAAGQINRVRAKTPPEDQLFSEDLY